MPLAKFKLKKSHTKDDPSPPSPGADFPLFPHQTGYWAKTIRGKTHYFGRWSDPYAAEDEYREVAEDLHAGRTPQAKLDGTTLADACNAFMMAKQVKLDGDNLSPRTFIDYDRICKLLISEFGHDRTS